MKHHFLHYMDHVIQNRWNDVAFADYGDAASAGNGWMQKTGTGDRRSGYAGIAAGRSGI